LIAFVDLQFKNIIDAKSTSPHHEGERTMRPGCLLLTAVVLLTSDGARGDEAESSRLFPFVLPWNDAAPGVTNLSDWLPKPVDADGHVRVGTDGHFYRGRTRVRFFGVNMCFDANFPTKQEAEQVAALLAKFGVNVVRFHHMDMFAFPKGIRARAAAGT